MGTDKGHKLLTSLPAAMRVAAEITPHRLASLLLQKGPLPIRLITLHLAADVPGFSQLSLSKQRRLIMGAMELGDPATNVVFEKIGWGQWAVRKANSDYIVAEETDNPKARINIHEIREKARLGWLKNKDKDRRGSITNHKTSLHNVQPPAAAISDSDSEASMLDIDNAIAEDSEEEVFSFELEKKPKFANRVPTKFSPPPALLSRRRLLLLAPGVHKSYRHAVFSRLRLNLLENLENYIASLARASSLSISLPPLAPTLPLPPWERGRRKLSFNELNIRSTLLSSLPKDKRHESDTDEEDWATIGAESLRVHSKGLSSPAGMEERTAARALVDLMSH